jgi:phytol kinase
MVLFLSVALIFVLLTVSEAWWRRRSAQHGEFSRKFIHITVGSFVAFWPYFMSENEIRLLSAAFVVVVLISKYLNIFSVIHSVQRPTWGEVWFAITVGLLTFVARDAHIYTAALLLMSLADGMAAIVGKAFGRTNRYYVFGSEKSAMGTLTFFVAACAILSGYVLLTHGQSFSGWLVAIALVSTLLENVGTRGTDNLLVPVFAAIALSALT